MAHRTLIISEEAYAALAKLKTQNESFTEVILRLSKQRETGKLSDYLEKIGLDEELAHNVEKASKRLRTTKLRKTAL
ncbi:MAG: antitoxin VapB family protein [Nitrososphaerales archaeon]